MWFGICFFLLIGGLAVLFPYRRGVVVTKSIRAILFVFRPGKSADRVTMDHCTGWISHIGRFYESRVYRFVLDAQLSKGEARVFLLDREKRPVLKLDRQSPAGEAELDRKNRYYLRWECKNATGSCTLGW